MNLSVKDICDFFLRIERAYGLLDLEVRGVRIWQVVRMPLYYEIAQKTGVLEKAHTVHDAFAQRLKSIGSFLISCTRHNPFLDRSQSDVLVFDHSRKMPINGKNIDIYTAYLIEKLRSEGKKLTVYEEPYLNRHYTENEPGRYHLDFMLILANIYAMLVNPSYSAAEKDIIARITGEIGREFNIQVDLRRMFGSELQKFRVRRFLFSRLLRIKRPDCIYLLVGYGYAPLIKAGKDMGITTVELQHGVLSPYHLGYHFPDTRKDGLEYFPDKLYLWDAFWKNMCSLPLSDANMVVHGFDHLNREKEKFAGVKRTGGRILVISQGTIGSRLAAILEKNIVDLENYTIAYKLHPGEYDRWREYDALIRLAALPSVTLIDNNNTPLYHLFAESEYVIGVFSTAVFEALYFNCRVILIDLPGIEYMRPLIESKKAALVGKDRRIIEFLSHADPRGNRGKKNST